MKNNQTTAERKNKKYLFQFHDGHKTIVDSDLLTKKEAYAFWDKHFTQVVNLLLNGAEVQMCIWKDCATSTNYHAIDKEVDYRDCIVRRGRIYKITETQIL